jgi:hypothetical protein
MVSDGPRYPRQERKATIMFEGKTSDECRRDRESYGIARLAWSVKRLPEMLVRVSQVDNEPAYHITHPGELTSSKPGTRPWKIPQMDRNATSYPLISLPSSRPKEIPMSSLTIVPSFRLRCLSKMTAAVPHHMSQSHLTQPQGASQGAILSPRAGIRAGRGGAPPGLLLVNQAVPGEGEVAAIQARSKTRQPRGGMDQTALHVKRETNMQRSTAAPTASPHAATLPRRSHLDAPTGWNRPKGRRRVGRDGSLNVGSSLVCCLRLRGCGE